MKNALTLVVKNDQPMMSSRLIAEVFGKEVKHVNEKARRLFPELVENSTQSFQVVTNDNGVYEYLLDEYQSTELVLGFSGEKARALRKEIVKTFVDYRNGRLAPKPVNALDSLQAMINVLKEQDSRLVLVQSTVDDMALTQTEFDTLYAAIVARQKAIAPSNIKVNGYIQKALKNEFLKYGGVKTIKNIRRGDFAEAMKFVSNFKLKGRS